MATNDDPQMHRLAAQSGINKLPVERNLRHMHSTESVLASIIESNIQTSTRFEQEVERGQRRKGEGGCSGNGAGKRTVLPLVRALLHKQTHQSQAISITLTILWTMQMQQECRNQMTLNV